MSSARSSFSELYHAHFDFTWRNLRCLGVAPADLDDATQEVFLVLLRKQRSLAPELPVRAWLYGVIRRLASRYHRGRSRRSRLHDAILEKGGQSPQSSASQRSADPARAYDHLEAAHLLDRFLDGLTSGQREVFVLAEIEQLSCREIADVLGANQNTIGSRLRSARRAFDRCFGSIRAEHLRLQDRHPEASLGRSVLSLSRRAHAPTPAERQRVGALLGIPVLSPPTGGELSGSPELLATTGKATGGPLAALAAQAPLRGALLALSLAGAAVLVADVDPPWERPEPSRAAPSEQIFASAGPPGAPAGERPLAQEAPELEDGDGDDLHGGRGQTSALEAALRRGSLQRSPTTARSTAQHGGAPPEPRGTTSAAREHAGLSPQSPSHAIGAELKLELELLTESRETLAQGNPAWALAKARTHLRRFPAGALAEERDSLRVLALCELGKLEEGRRLAAELTGKLSDPEIIRQFTAACGPGPGSESEPQLQLQPQLQPAGGVHGRD